MKHGVAIFVIFGVFALAVIALSAVAPTPDRSPEEIAEDDETTETTSAELTEPPVEVIAEHLSVPWGLAQLPDGTVLVTERTGSLVQIDGDAQERISLESADAGEGGALGVALHPQFEQNNFLYIYMTREVPSGGLVNRVVRYHYDPGQHTLTDETVILDGIPGANYHDGGRIAFGPEGYLYITTGDAGDGASAQNIDSLAGKILRLEDDGSIPSDNPFDNAVWTYGHRNPQGLAWDSEGRLWSTEHGRSGLRSGFDELNLIERGKNYGWPDIQGNETATGQEAPIIHSGPNTTWAPASLTYLDGGLYWGGLRGQTLYSVEVLGTNVSELTEELVGEYGRIRTVTAVSDGTLFITTSNTDGRGTPREEDDVVLRVDPNRLE